MSLFAIHVSSSDYRDLLASKGRFGLEFFYTVMNSGVFVWIFMLLLLVVPNLWGADLLIDKNSNLACFIKTRIGHKKYFINSIICNFVFSFLVVLFILIIMILFINFFYAPILFNYDVTPGLTTDARLFVSDEFANLCIFLVLTSLGYSIFSTFIFSLQTIVHNIYIYRILGVIIGLILYTGVAILFSIIQPLIPYSEYLLSSIFVGSLVNPGVINTMLIYNVNPIMIYMCSVTIYVLISFVILMKYYKKEHLYE